ncbi:MAG: apolipoprotein N-acyltransferase, partial [Acidobacteria bacterium]|nr:apolipoprotein N-acyltransferase [Acidobacteriota bacterium]
SPLLLFSLLALPLAYAAFVFNRPATAEREISIVAVQPNVSPLADYSPENLPDIFGRQLALTDRAVRPGAPDLILWNEAAVPYILSDDAAANRYLAKQLKKWDAPVLTGLIEIRDYADGALRPPLLVAQDRRQEFFNAAALFEPSTVADGKLPVALSELYLKRRLMPFLEHVPLSDRFPALADLVIPVGTRPRLSYGERTKTFDFRAKDGSLVRVGTMICYENLYPELAVDAVRDGAQVLTAITNEGFFAGSQGQYQLAAFARFRAIETRRALVRAAATGITRAVDRFGRVTAEVPVWSEQILRAGVALSDERTFYARFGDWLPKLCLAAVGLLIFAAAGKSLVTTGARIFSPKRSAD